MRAFIENYAEAWDARSIEHALKLMGSFTSVQEYDQSGVEIVDLWLSRLVRPTDWVMDYGCGLGRVARALSSRCAEVFLFDASPSMVSYANLVGVGAHNLHFGVIENPSIPLPGNYLHVSVVWDVFRHMEYADARLVVKNIADTTRPDGLIIASFPNVDSDNYRHAFDHEEFIYGPRRFRPWNFELIYSLFFNSGFFITDTHTADDFLIVAKKTSLLIPTGFEKGLKDVEEGRVTDMETVLSDVPPPTEPEAPAIVSQAASNVKDLIIKFYDTEPNHGGKTLPFFPQDNFMLINHPQGIGDCMVLTPIPASAAAVNRKVSIYSASRHFRELMKYNPHYEDATHGFCVAAADLQAEYDLGGGHFIQRLQRAYQLPVDKIPMGYLDQDRVAAVHQPRRVIMHFDPGPHAIWQRRWIHPRAREVYSESLDIIDQFVRRHGSNYSFLEIGTKHSNRDGWDHRYDTDLREMIQLIAGSDYFIGIMSGPMHIAAALGVTSIVIINFPDADKIFLPTLKSIKQQEAEWFYPQNMHLHQDGEGPLVPKFTLDNLERAFRKEVYPFGSQDYLEMLPDFSK